MNAKVKCTLNNLSRIGGGVVSGFSGAVASILRIMVLSSIKTAIKSKDFYKLKNHENCTILANGPSLKSAIENGEVRLDDVDVFCVNSFCESEYFWKIKPQFYFLMDEAFFDPKNERCRKQVQTVIENLKMIDWGMNLVVPSWAKFGELITGLNSPHIRILRYNTASVNGYQWFTNMMCRNRLGMLTCINVVIFAIMSAINMKYKNIYMYGIDHTFSAQLFVDEDNCVCSSERHVYSVEPRIFRLPQTTMYKILNNIATAFAIHEKLELYSKACGSKIYNCTKGSFVDAYERLKYNKF